MIVLFWDIDGTLLTTARAGVFALEGACEYVTGRSADLQSLKTDGLTDHQIAAMILEQAGVDASPEIVSRFIARYEDLLPESLPRREGRVLHGAREVLTHIRQNRPDIRLMLLSGNTPAGARTKLSYYGLWNFFEGGAFSEDCGPRSGIALRALSAVREHFPREVIETDPNKVYVVGDTPHDVECAKAIGARCIAVATGSYSLSELMACGPWKVLESLPDPIAFESLIGPPPSAF